MDTQAAIARLLTTAGFEAKEEAPGIKPFVFMKWYSPKVFARVVVRPATSLLGDEMPFKVTLNLPGVGSWLEESGAVGEEAALAAVREFRKVVKRWERTESYGC